MTQTVEKIAETLNNIQEENHINRELFEKALASINTKLELLSEDNETAEMLKFYISELKNLLQEKHSSEMVEFDNLSSDINAIPSKIVFDSLEQKIEKIEPLFLSLKTLLSESLTENNNELKEQFNKLQENYETIITIDEFSLFRTSLAEFIEKIIENTNILNSELTFNSEKLNELQSIIEEFNYKEDLEKIILGINNLDSKLADIESGIQNASNKEDLAKIGEKLENISDFSYDLNSINSKLEDLQLTLPDYKVNYDTEFENIAGSINEISTLFEDNSKMNYNNIVKEINSLQSKINEQLDYNSNISNENYEKVNVQLCEIIANINFLRDLSSQNSIEIFEKISENLQNMTNEITSDVNTNSEINFAQIKSATANFEKQLEEIKSNIDLKHDSNIFAISSGFDNLKISIENIISVLNSAINNQDSSEITSEIKETTSKIEELKIELDRNLSVCNHQIIDAINEMSLKMDNMPVNEEINNLKTLITALNVDFKSLLNDIDKETKNNDEIQLTAIKSICQNLESFQSQITEVKENINNYNDQLNEKIAIQNNILTDKSLNIESELNHTSQEIANRIELLQAKLVEFAHIVENSASDTEGKIAYSLEKITTVTNDLSVISEYLKSTKASTDERFTEISAVIDAGFENIIFSINSLNDSVNKSSEVSENLIGIDEKLDSLQDAVTSINNNQEISNDKFITIIEDKITHIKNELGSVNSDIIEALNCKTEEIIRGYEIVRDGVDQLNDSDFKEILNNLKSQMESSLTNLSVDLTGEISSEHETLIRLEQVFGETFNTISNLEELITEKLCNDIELLNVSLNSTLKENKSELEISFNNKLDEVQDILNEKLESIEDINRKLDILANDSSFEELNIRFDNIDDNTDNITNELNSLNNKLDVLASDTSINELSVRFDDLIENNEQINDKLQILDTKLDILDSGKSFDELNLKLNNLDTYNTQVSDNLNIISTKLDILAADESFDELNSKFENLNKNHNHINDILDALNAKIDVLAMDEQVNIEEELNNLKDLICDQRKYFEEISDEKTEAIDKYLRDVLLKLDNVDLEKSSEDIKESIINTVVSLINEISFVEETEDIKDFVEEKTDLINQNLIEVQNQLKQLTNPNDDFDYIYTLQDVESDIAKLRLAINNMPNANFDNFSDDIRKIIASVESLENSLTQDQIAELKNDIEKLNEDIISISTRTNKLLLTSDDSYKALNDGLNNFSSIIYKLEDKINYMDNTDERLERKLDNIHTLAVESSNADKVFHKVMMYMGEWIDSTTENISSIQDKASRITSIEESVNELKATSASLEEMKEKLPQEIALNFEEKFNKQEERIDRLEIKLDKILSALENDTALSRKLEKIEKILSSFEINIEKLASYVDEE